MDTDGGCYFHKHTTNSFTYRNFGMCFTSFSLPLVRSVSKVLKSLGIKFSLAHNNTRICIYSIKDIIKYFNIVGSSNPKNQSKLNLYLSKTNHRIRRSTQVVDEARLESV